MTLYHLSAVSKGASRALPYEQLRPVPITHPSPVCPANPRLDPEAVRDKLAVNISCVWQGLGGLSRAPCLKEKLL